MNSTREILKTPDRASNTFEGIGTAPAHVGELVQLMAPFYGRLYRCLVTLPCPELYSRCTVKLRRGHELATVPSTHEKTRTAVQMLLNELGLETFGGTITMEDNINEGHGCGSSTSNIVAALRATANALGPIVKEKDYLSPVTTGRLSIAAEEASDSTMFPAAETILWAQRDTLVLRRWHQSLPAMTVLSLQLSEEPVNTCELEPAKYSQGQIRIFEQDLLPMLDRGLTEQDPSLVGQAATISSIINNEFLPKPRFDVLLEITKQYAHGLSVAHSGTYVSFLLSPFASETDLPAQITDEVRAAGVKVYDRIDFRTDARLKTHQT